MILFADDLLRIAVFHGGLFTVSFLSLSLSLPRRMNAHVVLWFLPSKHSFRVRLFLKPDILVVEAAPRCGGPSAHER